MRVGVHLPSRRTAGDGAGRPGFVVGMLANFCRQSPILELAPLGPGPGSGIWEPGTLGQAAAFERARTPYPVNLASPDPDLWQRSVLGAQAMVVHSGSRGNECCFPD
ncbi:hypothetical protein DFAR_3800009 [Desulfarculales bacterium]